MSKDFRFAAVLAGCCTYAAGVVILTVPALILAAQKALQTVEPRDPQDLINSQLLWLTLTLASSVVGLLTGLVVGSLAKGAEIRHVIVFAMFYIGLALVATWLFGREIPSRGIEDVQLSIGRSAIFYASSWGSLFLGALLMKARYRRSMSSLRSQGLEPCERCEYPLEVGAAICPRCGNVA